MQANLLIAIVSNKNKRRVGSVFFRKKLDESIGIAETTCQAPDWDKPGRMVMVRQEIEKRPEAAGKQL